MKSAPFTADSGSAAKRRRDRLAPGLNPLLTRGGPAFAALARSLASASGPGSQATTSSPCARQHAAQPAPIRPAPTSATRRNCFFLAITNVLSFRLARAESIRQRVPDQVRPDRRDRGAAQKGHGSIDLVAQHGNGAGRARFAADGRAVEEGAPDKHG